MTRAACASERESRLRAERELNEAALATSQRLITLAESLARAERERDEARAEVARFTGGPKCAGVDWHFKTADALAAAQKRIEGLEAALRQIRDGVFAPNIVAGYALSSPAVTAEGKKLGDEGGGA